MENVFLSFAVWALIWLSPSGFRFVEGLGTRSGITFANIMGDEFADDNDDEINALAWGKRGIDICDVDGDEIGVGNGDGSRETDMDREDNAGVSPNTTGTA